MPYFHGTVICHARPDKAPRVSSFSTIAHTKVTEKKPSFTQLMAVRCLQNPLKCIYYMTPIVPFGGLPGVIYLWSSSLNHQSVFYF